MIIKRYCVVLSVICFLLQSYAGNRKINFDELEELLHEKNPHPFNGVILIAHKNSVLFKKCMGYSDRESRKSFTFNNQFLIGSITKQITAALIMRLAEKGFLSVHDPVSYYLPHDTYNFPDNVTIHHLLTHTATIDEKTGIPGSLFCYSNYGYNILGKIIEYVTRKPFRSVVQELFKKCLIKNACIASEGGVNDSNKKSYSRLVKGYSESMLKNKKGRLFETREKFDQFGLSSGGCLSDVYDMTKWNACLHNGKILNKSSYAAMCTPHICRPHRWGDLGYGYGIQIDENEGLRELSHNGWVHGFVSVLLYYPDFDCVVIVLENTVWKQNNDQFYFHDAVRCFIRNALINSMTK